MKWFEIPEALKPKLRELQEADANHEIVKSDNAVVMYYGMGDPMYLTFDGRVIIDECFIEDKGPRETRTFAEAAMAVVGAKTRKFPELLSILPARYENAIDCSKCEQSGWIHITDNMGPFVCEECGGLGWKERKV